MSCVILNTHEITISHLQNVMTSIFLELILHLWAYSSKIQIPPTYGVLVAHIVRYAKAGYRDFFITSNKSCENSPTKSHGCPLWPQITSILQSVLWVRFRSMSCSRFVIFVLSLTLTRLMSQLTWSSRV